MGTSKAAPADFNDLKQFIVSGSTGDFVFREGEPGTDCFLIRDGRIEILKTHQGQPRRLALLSAGDFFGEGALFDEPARDVTARAVTEFELLRLDSAAFQHIVQEDPTIALSMARRLSRYLRAQRVAVAPAPAAPAVREPSARPAEPVRPPSGPAGERAASEPLGGVLVVSGSKQEFVLADRPQWTVGRVGSNPGQKPDIDLTALDTEQSVSRKHAVILRKDGRFFVREERAANGTFVNGGRIEPGHEIDLVDGTRISFGLVETVFRYRNA